MASYDSLLALNWQLTFLACEVSHNNQFGLARWLQLSQKPNVPLVLRVILVACIHQFLPLGCQQSTLMHDVMSSFLWVPLPSRETGLVLTSQRMCNCFLFFFFLLKQW